MTSFERNSVLPIFMRNYSEGYLPDAKYKPKGIILYKDIDIGSYLVQIIFLTNESVIWWSCGK